MELVFMTGTWVENRLVGFWTDNTHHYESPFEFRSIEYVSSIPVSGKYKSTFSIYTERNPKYTAVYLEHDVVLSFTFSRFNGRIVDGKVSGSGFNEFGAYTISGNLFQGLCSMHAELTKTFTGPPPRACDAPMHMIPECRKYERPERTQRLLKKIHGLEKELEQEKKVSANLREVLFEPPFVE